MRRWALIVYLAATLTGCLRKMKKNKFFSMSELKILSTVKFIELEVLKSKDY